MKVQTKSDPGRNINTALVFEIDLYGLKSVLDKLALFEKWLKLI